MYAIANTYTLMHATHTDTINLQMRFRLTGVYVRNDGATLIHLPTCPARSPRLKPHVYTAPYLSPPSGAYLVHLIDHTAVARL